MGRSGAVSPTDELSGMPYTAAPLFPQAFYNVTADIAGAAGNEYLVT